MKKKSILILTGFFLILATILGGNTLYKKYSKKSNSSIAYTVTCKSAKELTQYSQIILQGEIVGKNDEKVLCGKSSDLKVAEYSVKINDVLKNNTNKQLKSGDTITLTNQLQIRSSNGSTWFDLDSNYEIKAGTYLLCIQLCDNPASTEKIYVISTPNNLYKQNNKSFFSSDSKNSSFTNISGHGLSKITIDEIKQAVNNN